MAEAVDRSDDRMTTRASLGVRFTDVVVRLARTGWLRDLLRRIAMMVPLFLVVTACSFVLVSVTSGEDLASSVLGADASESAYDDFRASIGLDQPLHERYGSWMSSAFQGELGESLYSGESVSTAIGSRLEVTASLTLGALMVSGVAGVALGIAAAVLGGWMARALDAFSLLGFALPSFWVGAILIYLLAVRVQWFPAVGYVPPSESVTEWLRSLTLPVIALGLHGVAGIAKQTREAMVDVLNSPHIRVARLSGVPLRSLYFVYAFKNAAPRSATMLGLQAITLLGGTVLVEKVFALPGLGALAVESALRGDIPVIQGIVLVFTALIVLINISVDLMQGMLDPRTRR